MEYILRTKTCRTKESPASKNLRINIKDGKEKEMVRVCGKLVK